MSNNLDLADKSVRRTRSGCLKWLLIAMVIVFVVFVVRRIFQPDPGFEVNTDGNRDMLSYLTNEGQLMLYDPLTRTQTVLLEGVDSYALSRDGRVAFTSSDETYSDVYVYDPANPSVDPINISQDPNVNHRPLAWHPNGHYLAYMAFSNVNDTSRYVSMRNLDHTFLIWDGETTREATLEDGEPAFSILSNVQQLVQWHIDSDEIPDQSSYLEGDKLIGLVDGGQVRFSFRLASGLSAYLVARNSEGSSLFRAEVGSVSWSGDGYLAFCRLDANGWVLSLWNGRRSWAVARTSEQPIQWQHGDTTLFCTYG
ncbi:MAG: hypothetical protein RLP44_26720 [Aggregatilineales bacterium]